MAVRFLFVLIIAGLFVFCNTTLFAQEKKIPVMTAKYAKKAVKIDGKLDDAVWKKATVYKLNLSVDKIKSGKKVQEAGEVMLAWDEKYFYVGLKLIDTDIAAEGKKDQLLHFRMGDVCELFLKPNDNKWYWELYVTPAGKKSELLYMEKGKTTLEQALEYKSGLKVAADVKGSLNNKKDRDQYWTAEMAMPVKDLTAKGDKFGPGIDWRILVARYNFSVSLKDSPKPELSAAPQLSKTNHHLLEEYAKLELVK